MLSPQLRNQVHNRWPLFWSAGLTNPLVAIEQITYLLFLRQLERLDAKRVDDGKPSIYYVRSHAGGEMGASDYNQCRWSYIRQAASFSLLNDTVFPWLRGLEEWLAKNSLGGDDPLRQVSGRLSDAYFVLDPNKTDTLTRAVQAIDDLFRQLDSRSANADIMGDVFEHLLGEIESSGKNGQFRTPRHIIRFMVELLDPPPGARILDPACGTGGFLVNTLLHWRAKTTDPETLRLEWDGTPHRAFGDGTVEQLPLDTCFTGYDNDRTMVRIGWMNLILHGLQFPRLEQRDSLSKRMADEESNTYDFILANPPFTGSVDEGDLSPNRQRFPAGKGNKPITTKSELLFVWLLLDLLKVGGRAAVVVPDGVLFGSTNAHRELRRQLLFENTLEGVVSLPAGVFLPYAGVKTSILVFQKAGEKVTPGADPRTREVWFYEVEDEAYSLDQKRKERPGQDNDLWDGLEKFKRWRAVLGGQPSAEDQSAGSRYWAPADWKARWRAIAAELRRRLPRPAAQRDQLLGIHEVFPDSERNPEAAAARVQTQAQPALEQLFRTCLLGAFQKGQTARGEAAQAEFDRLARQLRARLIKYCRGQLDGEYGRHGLTALEAAFDTALASAQADWNQIREQGPINVRTPGPGGEQPLFEELARLFAALDGYDVWLRSLDARPREAKNDQKPQLSWIVPVRAWASLESWGEDPKTKQPIKKPTHDQTGLVRADYLDWLRDGLKVFAPDGTVKEEFRDRLDPACLEAAEFNLSASRHKPFTFEAGTHRPPAEVIRELDGIHGEIRSKLGKLLAMVEGKE